MLLITELQNSWSKADITKESNKSKIIVGDLTASSQSMTEQLDKESVKL